MNVIWQKFNFIVFKYSVLLSLLRVVLLKSHKYKMFSRPTNSALIWYFLNGKLFNLEFLNFEFTKLEEPILCIHARVPKYKKFRLLSRLLTRNSRNSVFRRNVSLNLFSCFHFGKLSAKRMHIYFRHDNLCLLRYVVCTVPV
jgi:hypothetical protein